MTAPGRAGTFRCHATVTEASNALAPQSGFVQLAVFRYIPETMSMTPLLDWGRNPFEPFEPDGGCAAQLVHAERTVGLRGQLRQRCPSGPGVYGMLDEHGQLTYVGKAKSLRRRLLSYFRRRGRPRKSGRILRQTRAIAWELCSSEFAALHRELDLIRRWRPKWNVQGQPQRRLFAFVCLGRAPAPYLFLATKPAGRALASFGPVPLGQRARDAVRRVNDLFQLRDCPQSQSMIFAEEKQLFPLELAPACMRHDIGTCLGPCFAACSRQEYTASAHRARDFLTGNDRSLLVDLTQAMQRAASKENFEQAAALRDRLESIGWLVDKLDHVRNLRARESFIYPASGRRGRDVWFLIHGGRTLSAVPAPRDAASARTAAETIAAVYRQVASDQLLELYEHWDGMCLVRSWFRRHAAEKKKVILPSAALQLCLQVY